MSANLRRSEFPERLENARCNFRYRQITDWCTGTNNIFMHSNYNVAKWKRSYAEYYIRIGGGGGIQYERFYAFKIFIYFGFDKNEFQYIYKFVYENSHQSQISANTDEIWFDGVALMLQEKIIGEVDDGKNYSITHFVRESLIQPPLVKIKTRKKCFHLFVMLVRLTCATLKTDRKTTKKKREIFVISEYGHVFA